MNLQADAETGGLTVEQASRAQQRLCLWSGLALLLSWSLILGCGLYLQFVPRRNQPLVDFASAVELSIVNLVAVWSVLGPLRLVTRIPLGFLILGTTSLIYIMYCALDRVPNDLQMPFVFRLVPATTAIHYFGASFCFLLIRWGSGRHIGFAAGDPREQSRGVQFGIGQLLLWTTCIAVLVGGYRLLLILLWRDLQLPISLRGIAGTAGTYYAFQILLALPIPWAILDRRTLIRLPIVLFWVLAIFGLQTAIYRTSFLGISGQDWPSLLVHHGIEVLLLLTNLLIVRLCGYRLVPNAGVGELPVGSARQLVIDSDRIGGARLCG